MKTNSYPNIRLTSDMALSNGGNAATEIDPLNEDLSTVDTSFPLFMAGQLLEWVVDESKLVEATDPSKANRWSLVMKSLGDGIAQDGTKINAGAKIFLSAQLAPTGKSTVDIVKKGVAGLLQGLKQATPGRSVRNAAEWIPQLAGVQARAKTTIRAARKDPASGKEYKTTNELSFVP